MFTSQENEKSCKKTVKGGRKHKGNHLDNGFLLLFKDSSEQSLHLASQFLQHTLPSWDECTLFLLTSIQTAIAQIPALAWHV